MCSECRRVVERVDKAQIRIFLISVDRGVGRLDVEVGDVIGQDRHLVGVQFFLIFVPQLCGLASKMLDQFGDEGAGAYGGIEDFDILVDQRFAEMLLAQPVGALDHEAHDLVRRIDDAEPVGLLLVVDLVEVLVDNFEEVLLLMMAGDERGGALDRGVIGPQARQRVVFHLAGEERVLQRVEFLRHVVLAMKVAIVEDLREDFFRQDVLNQHFPHVGGGDARVDRVLRVLEEAK